MLWVSFPGNGTDSLQKIDGIMRNEDSSEATPQDISQKIDTWSQLPAGQELKQVTAIQGLPERS